MALAAVPSFIKPPNHRLVHCLDSSHCPSPASSLLVHLPTDASNLLQTTPAAACTPARPLCCPLNLAVPFHGPVYTTHQYAPPHINIYTRMWMCSACCEMQIMAVFQKDGGKQSCLESGLKKHLAHFQGKPIPGPPQKGIFAASFHV